MATLANAIEHLKHNDTPIWWLFNGTTKVGQYTLSNDMKASIDHLEKSVSLLPDGTYKLKSSDNVQNHSGAVTTSFSKSSNDVLPMSHQPATPAPTTNIYGVPDMTYAHLQQQFEQAFMMKTMYSWYVNFEKEWPEYKKKIDAIYDYLKDDDNDGTPDLFEMAKKGTDAVNAFAEIKKAGTNANLFG